MIIVALCFIAAQACGQSAVPPYIRATNTLDRLIFNGGVENGEMLFGIPMAPGKVVGDTYLTKEWRKSNLLLYENDKVIEGYEIRYDIKTDEIEIMTRTEVKVISGTKVKSFVCVDAATNTPVFYINARGYKSDKDFPKGFFEVVVDGKVPLFKHTALYIKKADYSEALDVGSRDDKILKQNTFYHAADDMILKIPRNKNKFLELFGDKQHEIDMFMSDNRLSLNKEEDLKLIYRHYNQLP